MEPQSMELHAEEREEQINVVLKYVKVKGEIGYVESDYFFPVCYNAWGNKGMEG